MRRLFFGSIAFAAAMFCMVMYASPLSAWPTVDAFTTPTPALEYVYVEPINVAANDARAVSMTARVYAFRRMEDVRTYHGKVRFGIGAQSMKPAARYLC